MRRIVLFSLSWLFGASIAFAQPSAPDISSAQLEANDQSLVIVTLDPGVDEGAVLGAARWSLVLYTKALAREVSVERVAVVTCSKTVFTALATRCPRDEKVIEVALQMLRPAPAEVTEVEVRLSTAGALKTGRFKRTTIESSGALEGAKADDADLAFEGDLGKTHGENGRGNYEFFAGYMRAISRGSTYMGRFGFYGEAKAEKSEKGDPNSFTAYGVYQRELGNGQFRGPFQSPWLNVRVPGVEFDKGGEQRNFVISPVVIVPFRFVSGRLGVIAPGVTIPHMTLQLGTELVSPYHSNLGVEGWRARWLAGATFRTGYAPESSGLYSISLTAAYVVRALTEDEPFKDPTHTTTDPQTGKETDPVFELGKRPRHLTKLEFEYQPWKWVGLSFQFEYGSAPPVFEITARTYTLGLKFGLKQTSYGRYAILKP